MPDFFLPAPPYRGMFGVSAYLMHGIYTYPEQLQVDNAHSAQKAPPQVSNNPLRFLRAVNVCATSLRLRAS